MKIFQKGFNYSQDGPGNRLVYHLQGCNFRCKWCSNPESMSASSDTAKEYMVDHLVDEANRSKPMFFDGGGVTLTGGEPTLQFGDISEFFQKLKSNGIHTAMETNGSHPRLLEIIQFVDYLIMDFKHFDDEIHKNWTGSSSLQTKKNIEEICKNKEVLIRIPLINNFNNNNPKGFADFFKKLNTKNLKFEFLPYHEYGKEKWKTPYEVKSGYVSNDDLINFKKTFKNNNLIIIET